MTAWWRIFPPNTGVAGSTAAGRAQAPPSWHVSPIGGLRVSGPWRMDRHVIVISVVGGTRLDLSQAELAAPEVTLTKVSLVGGVRVGVPTGIRVEASGFSLIGGTRVEPGPEPGPGAPTVHIRAFSLVGGVRIYRSGLAPLWEDRRSGRRARRDRLRGLSRPARPDDRPTAMTRVADSSFLSHGGSIFDASTSVSMPRYST